MTFDWEGFWILIGGLAALGLVCTVIGNWFTGHTNRLRERQKSRR
jgi:uncharacterized membrane protein YedE/YeeE